MRAIIIPSVEAESMTLRLPQNDFDAPDELVAPAPYSSASTKPTGAIPIAVNDNSKPSIPYQTRPASDLIHNYNLSVLRRVDGNPATLDVEGLRGKTWNYLNSSQADDQDIENEVLL